MPSPSDREHIWVLEAENESLRGLVSQTSADFEAFMDYYFASIPDLS